MRVEDVMTSSVRTCLATDNLHTVMQALWDHDLGSLPVVDAAGKPVAMITDRDVAMSAFTQGKPLHELRVAWAMSKSIITAHVNDGLSAAERTMRVQQLHRLPVVDESDRLVGVITLNDIARTRTSIPTARSAEQRELVSTVAAIARKRSALSVEEYASQQMVSFDKTAAPKRSKTVTVVKKRERARPALPTESGVFATAAVLAAQDVADPAAVAI